MTEATQSQGRDGETQMQSMDVRETESCHVPKPFLLITQMAANMLQHILEGGESFCYNCIRCSLFLC